MYAIQNKRTKQFVYGTDFRYDPTHQRCSFNQCIIFDTYESAEAAMLLRRCGKSYRVIPVKIVEVEE